MRHTFEVYGKVRGQGRPRTDFRRRKVYKAPADREWEDAIKEAYINSGGPHFGGKPVRMMIEVYRALPASSPKRTEWEPDTHKPDATNIAKSVEDALNGIAYYDDSQVVMERCEKHPRERRVEMMFVTITDDED